MAASIALGCGGKALVCGSRPWRGSRQARFVTRLHFCHQQFFCSRRTEACLWHETDMPKYLGDVRCWVNSGKHVLSLSFSGFDPTATWNLINAEPVECPFPARGSV